MSEPKCSDCNVTMTAGLTIDRADYDIPKQLQWVGGDPPEVSNWLGGGLKLKDRERLNVFTYRCPKCGQLKSYAR